MNASDMKTAAVLGAGTMGHGIAQVLAMTGLETRLFDVAPEAVERGLQAVAKNLEAGVSRGKVEASVRDSAITK
ncbi:MAG TPA: 3-hydroxyacyl-CoA dehydrogenase NAD-binding domain-containing protein, partial [Planctomycetota bacterium]|nr:3-hydroxyacyl-CoA dehydrogenase NAD-binding domain-containing protein [Planctomycetota bacterium]